MSILIHFKAIHKDSSDFYKKKTSRLLFPWVPFYGKEKLKIHKRGAAFERPVNSHVQRVSYRHELQIANFNGVHINIKMFDHNYLNRYHLNPLMS